MNPKSAASAAAAAAASAVTARRSAGSMPAEIDATSSTGKDETQARLFLVFSMPESGRRSLQPRGLHRGSANSGSNSATSTSQYNFQQKAASAPAVWAAASSRAVSSSAGAVPPSRPASSVRRWARSGAGSSISCPKQRRSGGGRSSSRLTLATCMAFAWKVSV